ncbi:Rho-guanine nucleotide exchange factor, partial [Ophiophagus hannah]
MKIRKRTSRPKAQQYSPFEAYRRRPNPSTFFAAAKLSAMLNGNDEVYANRMVVDQLEDAGVKYINNSQSNLETNTDSSKDPEVLENIPSNKNLSSVMIPSLDTSGSYMPLKKIHGLSNLRNHRYPFIKKRSSSLDDLDVDNGDERSHNCYSSVSYNSSVILPSDREQLSASEPTTRLDSSMNRAESLPLSSSLQSKESLLSGIRSRSYSYTSPKVLLGKPPCAQEFIQCDSNDDLSFRDTPQPAFLATLPSTTIPIGVSLMKKEALQQQHSLSRSVPSTTSERKSMSSLEPDTNSSSWRSRSHSEELLQTLGSTSSVDSFIIEDDVDASLWNDLSTDTLEFEAESWSLVVEPWFCNQQEKDVIKRQDVIFELMQTEVHHIHTLFIMSKIFRKGMKEELQLDHSTVDKIFPCLDELLELHQQFFCRMKERRQLSSQKGSDRNFVISEIGDVLVQQKPAVIALQKLIVREVANEERGMFLISASSTGPEMYEIHTSSKEERSHWMRQIQEAVESCPEEEGKIGDSDEDRKITEARAAKIQKCQVLLNNQDQQICNYLEEKLHIYAKLGNMSGFEEVQAEPHLLIKPDSGETPQVASLLTAALKEGTELHKVEKEICNSDMHDENNVAEMDILDQAALTIQDTHIEINKLLLQEHERSSLSHSPRSTFFLEQEKHRNLKEEFANIHKLQQQFQQEQQRWHRECEQQQQAHETRECRLLEKEKECCSQEELLCKNREELDSQFQDYQQNLQRLQESQRMVEKERETVRLQQNILHHWKHNHQSNLPAVISSGNNEIMGPLHLDSFCGENSAIIKETLVQMSLNHLNRSNSLAYQDCGNSVNLTDSELPRRTENQANFNMDISCQQTFTADLSKSTGPRHHPSSNTNQSDVCNNRKL